MDPIQTEVQCYASHKADESPRRFWADNQWVEVDGLLESWVQAPRNSRRPRAEYFKVQANDGRNYLLRHDLRADEWFIEPFILVLCRIRRYNPEDRGRRHGMGVV